MEYCLLADDELVARLKAGEHAAVKEIYDRYWKPVYFIYQRKLRNAELAEELTQNLFVSLWEKRQTAEIGNLRFYLFGAVKYSIINHYKALNIKLKHLGQYSLGKQEQENVTEKQVMLHDLSAAIAKGIEVLPLKSKQVFALSRMQHHSVKEISSHLNISEKTVEYHITRSVKALRLYLKEYLLGVALILFLLH